MAKASLSFGFHKSVGMPKMDLETTSIFLNLTIGDIQLMNKGVPCRGGQTKDYKHIKVFMKAFTKPRAMALDAYASTSECNRVLLIISFLVRAFRTLLMDGVHCGFQGLLVMLVSIVVETYSQLKVTLSNLKL